MAAVGIAQVAAGVVVISKEERGVAIFLRVLVKKTVYRLEEPVRILESNRVLAAQNRLEIAHEQGGRDALAGNVRDHNAEPAGAQIEKVIIVAPNHSRLDAGPRVIERFKRRHDLRKQAGLCP